MLQQGISVTRYFLVDKADGRPFERNWTATSICTILSGIDEIQNQSNFVEQEVGVRRISNFGSDKTLRRLNIVEA